MHQHTFDLALYARIAWGLAHGDLWAPLIDASALGCHIAPVLLPLCFFAWSGGMTMYLLALFVFLTPDKTHKVG